MTQLTESVIRKSKFVIGERLVHVEGLLCRDANFQFMLSPRISYYFKIMNTIKEWTIRGDRPKVIIRLVQESMAVV
jgi:hypothetical protein